MTTIVESIDELSPLTASVCTLGMFDGLHRGHRAIIQETVSKAKQLGVHSVLITFTEHPRSILQGREAPKMITSLAYRLKTCHALGIDFVVALRFTEALSQLSRRSFVERVFVKKLQCHFIVLGYNCKFGQGGKGDIAYLQDMKDGYKFDVGTVAPVLINNQAVSSTSIRQYIEAGELDHAAAMLGRSVSLLGTVVHGDHRGTMLGFRTANLDVHHQLTPPNGVYCCRAIFENNETADAVTNVGFRPTFGTHNDIRVETHILDYSGDLYGRDIELQFFKKLRDEQKFSSADALTVQIQKDVDACKQFLSTKVQL